MSGKAYYNTVHTISKHFIFCIPIVAVHCFVLMSFRFHTLARRLAISVSMKMPGKDLKFPNTAPATLFQFVIHHSPSNLTLYELIDRVVKHESITITYIIYKLSTPRCS
jgi:hypothetical protein